MILAQPTTLISDIKMQFNEILWNFVLNKNLCKLLNHKSISNNFPSIIFLWKSPVVHIFKTGITKHGKAVKKISFLKLISVFRKIEYLNILRICCITVSKILIYYIFKFLNLCIFNEWNGNNFPFTFITVRTMLKKFSF